MPSNFIRFTPALPCFVTLLVVLSACQNPSPADPKFRVKKVSIAGNQETSTTTYRYDSQGRLASMYKTYTQRSKGSNVDTYYTTVLQYDDQGRLLRFENQPDLAAPGTILPSQYTYEYDDKGNSTTIQYVVNPQSPSANTTFRLTYAGNTKFPIRITSGDETFDYTYAGGNVVAIKRSSANSTLPDFNYTQTYQFDDKPNPFYGLYIGEPDPAIFNTAKRNTFYEINPFNQNNMLLPGLTYTYDAYGNLLKSAGVYTTTYEYEQY